MARDGGQFARELLLLSHHIYALGSPKLAARQTKPPLRISRFTWWSRPLNPISFCTCAVGQMRLGDRARGTEHCNCKGGVTVALPVTAEKWQLRQKPRICIIRPVVSQVSQMYLGAGCTSLIHARWHPTLKRSTCGSQSGQKPLRPPPTLLIYLIIAVSSL